MTKENYAYLLQQELVQTCIEFIKKYNLTDIEEVRFTVDCLSPSVKEGSWQASTDSTLQLLGIGDDGYYEIGFSA